MGISGSDRALCYALSGVERSGATRSDATSAHWFVSIGGTQRRGNVVQGSLVLNDELNDAPNTLLMTLVGLTPTKGQEVIVTLGSQNNRARLFAGVITNVRTRYDGKLANIVRDVQATDYTYLLNQRVVRGQYLSQSVTVIAKDLIDHYTTGFTYANVADGLETLDEITFTDETMSGALTRLANRIGAYWYIDAHKDVHFWTGEEVRVTNPTDITSTTVYPAFSDLSWSDDISGVVDRVYVEGYGSLVTLETQIGAATLPVNDASPFNAAGGVVTAPNAQLITYTGLRLGKTSAAVARPAPANTPVITDITPGGLIGGATYTIKVSFIYADGSESLPSAASNALTVADNHTWSLASLELGPTGVTARRIYVAVNDSVFDFYNLVNDNSTTSFNSTAVNSGGTTAGTPRTTALGYTTGHTRIYVADTAQFESAGGTAHASDLANFNYTGRTVSSGLGALTGVPASGTGSLNGINVGDPVTNSHPDRLPALTGIPATGDGAITTAIGAGAEVYLRVQVDDTAAQATLAALIGGDGIQEDTIQDRRISEDEATARGEAFLALKSTAVVSAHYRTRDKQTGSGKTITITAVNGLTATLRIQRARWSGFSEAEHEFPLIEVDAASSRFSLQDLLRQVRKHAEGIPT